MTTSQEVFRRQVRRLILVPLIVSLLIAAVLELQVRRLTSAQGWVEHTDFVIAQSRLLLRSMIDQGVQRLARKRLDSHSPLQNPLFKISHP